jgi:hypothetical protein
MFGSREGSSSEVDVDADKDWVLRQIRQLVQALARLFAGKPTADEVAQAEESLREASRSVLRVDWDLLDKLTPTSAARLLGEADRVAGYAELVDAHAALARAAGRHDEAERLHDRAEELRGAE